MTNRIIYVVAHVFGGVLDSLEAYTDEATARTHMETQAKKNGFHMDSLDHWTSADEDDDITMWSVQLKDSGTVYCCGHCTLKGTESCPEAR